MTQSEEQLRELLLYWEQIKCFAVSPKTRSIAKKHMVTLSQKLRELSQ